MSQLLTIISDCRDDNARARQQIRYQSLFPDVNPIFIGVNSDLEAQGNLIDIIDAHQDAPGIIVVNVAPRGNKEKYPNGIPFCFHKFNNLIIIGTPNCFSLAKKLGLFSKTYETDVRSVCNGFLPPDEAERIASSQFRSYEYLPYLAKWIIEGKAILAREFVIEDFGKDDFVWNIDCFGDCKTTAIKLKRKSKIKALSQAKFYERLADVPKDEKPAFTCGSSGYKNKRFIEIVIQNKSASEILNLKIGSKI